MKPIIGICTNHSFDDSIGTMTNLGFRGQDWQVIAGDYIKAVELAGGCPVIIPIVDKVDTIWEFVKRLDGIIFTGGSDINPYHYGENPMDGLSTVNPFRDYHEIELCKKVLYETEIPILGICRGCQLINITAGGTLYQDLKTQWLDGFNHNLANFPKYYPSHEVVIEEESKLRDIFGKSTLGVNSFNHQAIKDLGKDLIPTMKSEDGLIEGIEMEGHRFVVAVQWHPEMMVEKDESYLDYFRYFIEICKGEEKDGTV